MKLHTNLAILAAFALTACEQPPSETGEATQSETVATGEDRETEPSAATVARSERQAIPARFLGVWDYVEGSCDPASDLRMEISARRIVFYESVGDVTSVEVANDNTVTVAMNLSGEGETWKEALTLELVDGGRQLIPSDADGDTNYEPMPRKKCAS